MRILTASSSSCGLSYQRIVETITDGSPVVPKTAITPKQPILKRQQEVDSENDDEPKHFRRVRMKCRQRARNRDGQDEKESKALSDLGEETIRCICGAQDDYSNHLLSASIPSLWLIQCIDCKVWQHRSCVGTANGNDPSSGYYCERCPRLNRMRNRPQRMSRMRKRYLQYCERKGLAPSPTVPLKWENTDCDEINNLCYHTPATNLRRRRMRAHRLESQPVRPQSQSQVVSEIWEPFIH